MSSLVDVWVLANASGRSYCRVFSWRLPGFDGFDLTRNLQARTEVDIRLHVYQEFRSYWQHSDPDFSMHSPPHPINGHGWLTAVPGAHTFPFDKSKVEGAPWLSDSSLSELITTSTPSESS